MTEYDETTEILAQIQRLIQKHLDARNYESKSGINPAWGLQDKILHFIQSNEYLTISMIRDRYRGQPKSFVKKCLDNLVDNGDIMIGDDTALRGPKSNRYYATRPNKLDGGESQG